VLRKELMDVALDNGSFAGAQFSNDQHFVQMFILRIAVGIGAGLS
jgi:hypothetical protein